MRVLAIDPGGTTGWATWVGGSVHWGQIPGGIGSAREVVNLMRSIDTLVIERYTISERTTKYSRQSDALELTGAMKYVAQSGNVPVIMQQPAEAKRIFTDERLRQFGWWARGEEHARDALRHLGLYLAKQRVIRLTGGGTDGGM